MTDRLSRRTFLKISATAAVGITATGLLRNSSKFKDASPPSRYTPLDESLLPRYQAESDVSTALARRYPWLRFGQKPGKFLQIATGNSLEGLEIIDTTGLSGERIMKLSSGASVLPWTPMFSRPTRVYAAEGALQTLAGTGRLFIKDEGSEAALLFGNKIRKYEFLLPNLAYSGIKTLRTYGSYGSNHCAYLTLAARYGRYRNAGDTAGMNVELMLYPQDLSDNVLTKLRLLVASGARLKFLDGDTSVGLSILGDELRSRGFVASTTAYVPPGGSSPLSVLGHLEAMLELAEQIQSSDCPLTAPPDYIFVSLGSGATAMGLVLGCYLLGWPTRVVGTCSQDKGRLARLVINGDASTPFLLANAASLLEKSLKWVEALGLAQGSPLPDSNDLLRHSFICDSDTWHPSYGKITPQIAREAATAAEAGLILDNTFTAKSFHTLRVFVEQGMLNNRSALFWNSYQRFPLEKLLPKNSDWLSALPEPVRERINDYMKMPKKKNI
jgi:1-aminocyclopropane-1-carboxylate deaminase/D-cysteine desulfhydrase-like pyridoxal-dependent ACC family enzyme